MIIPTKKLANGFEMPVYGLGTWTMGGRQIPNPATNDQKDITAIKSVIEMGVTHIDTAEVYASGHAEELVAAAIKGYERSKLFIVSKVTPTHFHYEDVLKACEASLTRLQTGYLDLYLLHAPNHNIQIQETMRAMDELKTKGRIRNIGISNFNTKSHEQAQAATRNPIVVNQVHYSLIYREPEIDGLLRYSQEHDALLMAWRPVEKGRLTEPGIPILDEMCQKYGKTPAQVAINWLTSQAHVITLAKTSNLEHLKENLGGLGWEMESDDIERLRAEFPDQQNVSDAVPLG